MCYYIFNITSYADSGDTIIEHGIIAGHDFIDATKNLVEYYGESNVEKFNLSLLSENVVFINEKLDKEIEALNDIW